MRKFTAAAITSTAATAVFALSVTFGATPAHEKDAIITVPVASVETNAGKLWTSLTRTEALGR